MKTLIIDNYDSFTYNLYQYVGSLGGSPEVVRNDAVTVQEIMQNGFSHIIISPGPGSPDARSFGVCRDVIRECGRSLPVLGVCLGHQGIISAFGGKIIRASLPRHGKTSKIFHDGNGVFEHVPNPLTGMRYHSLVGHLRSIPDCLIVTATALDDQQIMGVRHRELPIEGIQFHPESVGTEYGMKMIENFLNQA